MLAPKARELLLYNTLPSFEETYLRNRLAMHPNCNLLDDVPQIDGFFSLAPREIYCVTALPYERPDRAFAGLLDFLAVSQTTVPGRTIEWTSRPSAMPIITAGQRPVFAGGLTAFEAFYRTNFDFRQVVILPLQARVSITATQHTVARVLNARFPTKQSPSRPRRLPPVWPSSPKLITRPGKRWWMADQRESGARIRLPGTPSARRTAPGPVDLPGPGLAGGGHPLRAGLAGLLGALVKGSFPKAVVSGASSTISSPLTASALTLRLTEVPDSNITQVQTEPSQAKGGAEDWLTPGRFALLLGVLIFVTFPGVLLGSTTFIIRDFGLFGYPLAYFHRQSFWRGELPLWNPLSKCGLPFLAQWNTLTLYPLSLIYLLLPLTWSLSFFCLAHMFWGGLGMYLLAYRWTGHRLAAALAGIIFAFNGLTMNALMWPNVIAALGWLPWVVWLGQRAWREGGKAVVWGALAGGMQMLAAGPEVILLTWVILFVLACGDWVQARGAAGQARVTISGNGLLVALICAAQLLPFLELLARSQRDAVSAPPRLVDARLGLGQLSGAVVPNFAHQPGLIHATWAVLDLLLLCRDRNRVAGGSSGAAGARLAGAGAGRAVVPRLGFGLGQQRLPLSRVAPLVSGSGVRPLPGEICNLGFGGRAPAGCVWVCGTGRQIPACRAL